MGEPHYCYAFSLSSQQAGGGDDTSVFLKCTFTPENAPTL